MARRAATTIILVTRDTLFRADLGRDARVLGHWSQARPEVPELPSLVEIALLLGPKVGRRVWVFLTDLWTQTLEFPAHKTSGVNEAELSGALNFEVEPLSGANPFESMLGHIALREHDGQQGFWIVQARTVDVEEIDAIIRKAGGRLVGVGHPGGLPHRLAASSTPGSSWQRIELWPDAVVAIRTDTGEVFDIEVFNADPQMGRWKNEVETWQQKHSLPEHSEILAGPGVAPPDIPSDQIQARPVFRLDNDVPLGTWLTAVAERVALKQPGMPLLHPAPVPLSPGQRRGIATLLLTVLLLSCFLHHQFFLDRQLKGATDERKRILQDPQARLTEMQKQVKDLDTKHDQMKKQIQELQQRTDQMNAQRRRLARLLASLSEQRHEELLIQKIENQGSEPHLHGICLRPELGDQLARALAEKLHPLGWEVQACRKKAMNLIKDGGPWEFDIKIKMPVDPATVTTPGRPRRS